MLTIAVIVLVFAVRAVLKSSIKEENVQSVFAKILLNHVQMISITASFDMDWPESVKYIFAFAAPVKDLTDAIVQFDCFMDLRTMMCGVMKNLQRSTRTKTSNSMKKKIRNI